ncbi:hypothetical protein EWM64_g8571 [Hericium alpestre]|uniref:Pheromone-processing carboxypeptidase KEX1 n=1 Tax=Hericium alpestre TaxID=135208 RepID=A0A4Y9ZL03_9AGAM|nr:hypothetical protein EWM64_g8571 [Hericium alpestre]
MRLTSWKNFLTASFLLALHTPSVRTAPTDIPSAASFYVHNLPDLHQDDTHPLHIYAGHLSADPQASTLPDTTVSAHLYFVLIKARRTADRERILFWFNGGPGCSSFDGLMMEVGPWRVDGEGGLRTIEGGWEEYTTIVYIDSRAGTGFSYTSTDRYVHELGEASTQFVEFLHNFYRVFPEYQPMDTYIGGESFAGQYIPYFGTSHHYATTDKHSQQDAADAILSSSLGINLRGAAIGNGWIDARRQYPAFLEYAIKHGIVEEGSEYYNKGKSAIETCENELKKIEGEPVRVDICENIMGAVSAVRDREVNGQKVCLNVYDVRLDDIDPACGMNWPPDLANVTTYLRRPDVKSALNAQAKSEAWTECQNRISRELWLHDSPSAITLMPRILETIEVLIFAGDQDYICNYVGQEAMIQAMTWNGETGLGQVETQTWTVDDQPAGTWVSSRNLTYAKARSLPSLPLPHALTDSTGLQRLAHGRLRRPARLARHDPALHGHELLRDHGRLCAHPEQRRRRGQARVRRHRARDARRARQDARAKQGDVGGCASFSCPFSFITLC